VADKVTVELGGKSKYEVARAMAQSILELENKWGPQLTRQEYLKTVLQCIQVLSGIEP
jgi:hypothetical protein